MKYRFFEYKLESSDLVSKLSSFVFDLFKLLGEVDLTYLVLNHVCNFISNLYELSDLLWYLISLNCSVR